MGCRRGQFEALHYDLGLPPTALKAFAGVVFLGFLIFVSEDAVFAEILDEGLGVFFGLLVVGECGERAIAFLNRGNGVACLVDCFFDGVESPGDFVESRLDLGDGIPSTAGGFFNFSDGTSRFGENRASVFAEVGNVLGGAVEVGNRGAEIGDVLFGEDVAINGSDRFVELDGDGADVIE